MAMEGDYIFCWYNRQGRKECFVRASRGSHHPSGEPAAGSEADWHFQGTHLCIHHSQTTLPWQCGRGTVPVYCVTPGQLWLRFSPKIWLKFPQNWAVVWGSSYSILPSFSLFSDVRSASQSKWPVCLLSPSPFILCKSKLPFWELWEKICSVPLPWHRWFPRNSKFEK